MLRLPSRPASLPADGADEQVLLVKAELVGHCKRHAGRERILYRGEECLGDAPAWADRQGAEGHRVRRSRADEGPCGTVRSVVPDGFTTFFATTAAVAGALIGLLFVAISVAPELEDGAHRVQTDVRAGIAFSALINALVLSLFALIPDMDLGTTAIVLGLVSLSSCIALGIFLLREGEPGPGRRRQLRRLGVQGLLFAYQVAVGAQLTGAARDAGDVTTLAVLTIVLFIVGIARAWQLIGARDSGLMSEIGETLRARSRNRGAPPVP